MSDTTIPLLVLGIAILVIGIALWMTTRQTDHSRQLASQIQAAWQETGQTARYGPVQATWFGYKGENHYRGVVAILDDSLIFTTRVEAPPSLVIPLDRIRWIGFWQDLGASAEKRAARVEVEGPEVWQVLTFALLPLEEFARQLGEATSLPVDYSGGGVERGPVRAERTLQDVYGQWQTDRQGLLFLAPDRLLFDWREPIFLASIRRLEVVSAKTANPLTLNLLRIDYDAPDGTSHAVGFRMRDAGDWAEMLQLRTEVPVERAASRKKKTE